MAFERVKELFIMLMAECIGETGKMIVKRVLELRKETIRTIMRVSGLIVKRMEKELSGSKMEQDFKEILEEMFLMVMGSMRTQI